MTERRVSDLEAKHGMPLDQIPGQIYVLHYEVPQVVRSVSRDYAGPSPATDADGFVSATPIRHYVGWTQQARPSKRISRHGPAAYREVVYLEPGTSRDEKRLKLTGTCPKCGEPLAASLDPDLDQPAQLIRGYEEIGLAQASARSGLPRSCAFRRCNCPAESEAAQYGRSLEEAADCQ
jgi:hypothetical protein